MRVVARIEEALLAFLLAAMTLVTFTQVVLRYIFNSGFIWALEATVYLFAWLILLGISYGVRAHAHIGVDFVVKALPPVARRIVGLIAIGLCLLYAGIMLVGSYNYVFRLYRLGVLAEDIPVKRWLLAAVMPLGFALLGFRLLQQALLIYTGLIGRFEMADEAADVLRDFDPGGRAEAARRR
ncbi:MAG: TRAP transporter small permease [Geminicoccaceae bacterium]